VQHLSSRMQHQHQIIEWRRTKVMELLSKGESNQSEIARILQVDKSIISRDIQYLRWQSKENIKKYVDERLPEEYKKTLTGLTVILKEMWAASDKALDTKEKVLALSLAKKIYDMRINLLTNASTPDTAMKFISELKEDNNRQGQEEQEQKKENKKVPGSESEEEVGSFSKGPTIEEKREETTTINQVF
jgi:cobalamin biosynthesis Mg chelatase CobN